MASLIDALPDVPQRSDPDNFAARGDAFLAALPDFQAQANALALENEGFNTNCIAQAAAALVSELSAAASAAAAAAGASAAMWVAATNYTLGTVVFSPIDFYTYRNIVAGVHGTDPSNDPTNWRRITILGQVITPRTSNTIITNADIGKRFVITSGTFAQTIAAVSTLQADFFVDVFNFGTGVVTFTPSAALPDFINGNTTRVMYTGEEVRISLVSGVLSARVLRGFTLVDTAAGAWQPESGYAGWWVDADGSGSGGASGGSGGSGSGSSASSSGKGGTGGGGGANGGSGQRARQWIDAARLAAKITGAGRGTIAYAPGAGGTGGAGRTGGIGATSGNQGNDGVVGLDGAAGNPTTFGTTNDSYYLTAAGGNARSGGTSGGGGAGQRNGNAASAGPTPTIAALTAAGPDIQMVFKTPSELTASSAAASAATAVATPSPGSDGGRGGSHSLGPNVGAGDVTSGATAAPGGVGSLTVGAATPATPATPPQAPAGCGGYGSGGGGGSCGVGVAGSNSATQNAGNSPAGGLGGPGQIRVRAVL